MTQETEKRKASRKKYRESHREQSSARTEAWKKLHPGYMSVYMKMYYQENKEEINAKKRKLKYGIDAEEFNRLFELQGGRCGICGKHQSKMYQGLGVDHNHDTDQIRGLLCPQCNTAIGLLQDDPILVRLAADYLEKWNE